MGWRPRRTFSYPLSLAVVVAMLVLLTGGWIALWNYRSGLTNARTLAGTLFDQVAKQTADATGAFLLRAPPAAETLASLGTDDAAPLPVEARARRLLAVLRANPGFTWVSYSDQAGEFTGVHRTPAGTIELNHSAIIDGKTVLDESSFAADGTLTPLRHDDDTHYDPRTRPFYAEAQAAHHGVWTPPYVFAEGVPGITYAAPVGTSGVVTIDFSLGRLSEVVRGLRFSEHGVVAVASEAGLALAHPSAALVSTAKELVRAADLADPALRALLAAGASAQDFTLAGTPYLARSVTIPIPGGPAWQVLAYAPESDFTAGLRARVVTSLLISMIAVVIAVALGWWLARRVSGPLTALAAQMAEVGEFHLSETAPEPSMFREIANMNEALAKMKGGLRSFARYVPRDLVRSVLASGQDAVLAGEVRELTIYFSDLAGFTTLAESLPPDELVKFLGEYFDDMSRIIAEEHGTVDKYLGDGIMAFWGAPTHRADHAAHACAAALRCHRRIGELAARGTKIEARIGIATGSVVVGNIGSPERMNYTVMGDTANLASRIEGLNKQYRTHLMISEVTYEQAKATVVARPVDVVAVKGKQRGVRVYELLALVADHDAVAETVAAESTTALEAYLARDFATAAAAWDRVLEHRPEDPAATTMRDRARAFEVTPPPPAWQGVTVATEK